MIMLFRMQQYIQYSTVDTYLLVASKSHTSRERFLRVEHRPCNHRRVSSYSAIALSAKEFSPVQSAVNDERYSTEYYFRDLRSYDCLVLLDSNKS